METKYIMITSDKFKFFLTLEERDAVNRSIAKGDKFLVVQDSTIPLSICPTMLPIDKWREDENNRLYVSGNKLCKKCNTVRDIQSTFCSNCQNKKMELAKLEDLKLPSDQRGLVGLIPLYPTTKTYE